jgi:hypothetical protein
VRKAICNTFGKIALNLLVTFIASTIVTLIAKSMPTVKPTIYFIIMKYLMIKLQDFSFEEFRAKLFE